MYHTVVINVDELWLKGKNRPVYFKKLRSHIKELIKKRHGAEFKCNTEEQRMVARSDTAFSEDTIQALLKVPGIHSVMPSRRVKEVTIEAIFDAVKEELEQMKALQDGLPNTFKVETRRSWKGFPMQSMEVSREVGGHVLRNFEGIKVDVKNPELRIEIRIMERNAYVASRNMKGIGGLPAGTSGHLITLLSGGFDSPVASFLMSKRGCKQTFVFFYAYPFVGDEVKTKIMDIAKVLGQYQRHSRLHIIPFGNIQDLIAKHCETEYRTILFRKAMLQCSEILARRIKAGALLTGDSLGQVSSQTIGNISVAESSVELPIFRPLVGYNKIEIIDLARKIGTHDISIIPHDDACSLFAPKHPIIKPDKKYVAKFESVLPLHDHLEKCLDEAEIYNISLTGDIIESSK